jgi:hypothetical protein
MRPQHNSPDCKRVLRLSCPLLVRSPKHNDPMSQIIPSIVATKGSRCSDRRLRPTYQVQPRKRRNLGLAPVVPVARMIPPRKAIPCPKRSPSLAAIISADVATKDCRPTHQARQRKRRNLGLAPVVPVYRMIPPSTTIKYPENPPFIVATKASQRRR